MSQAQPRPTFTPSTVRAALFFSWYDSSGKAYGALLTGKTFYKFSDPKGPDYTKPDDINDKRDVVGRFESTSSRSEQSLEATY